MSRDDSGHTVDVAFEQERAVGTARDGSELPTLVSSPCSVAMPQNARPGDALRVKIMGRHYYRFIEAHEKPGDTLGFCAMLPRDWAPLGNVQFQAEELMIAKQGASFTALLDGLGLEMSKDAVSAKPPSTRPTIVIRMPLLDEPPFNGRPHEGEEEWAIVEAQGVPQPHAQLRPTAASRVTYEEFEIRHNQLALGAAGRRVLCLVHLRTRSQPSDTKYPWCGGASELAAVPRSQTQTGAVRGVPWLSVRQPDYISQLLWQEADVGLAPTPPALHNTYPRLMASLETSGLVTCRSGLDAPHNQEDCALLQAAEDGLGRLPLWIELHLSNDEQGSTACQFFAEEGGPGIIFETPASAVPGQVVNFDLMCAASIAALQAAIAVLSTDSERDGASSAPTHCVHVRKLATIAGTRSDFPSVCQNGSIPRGEDQSCSDANAKSGQKPAQTAARSDSLEARPQTGGTAAPTAWLIVENAEEAEVRSFSEWLALALKLGDEDPRTMPPLSHSSSLLGPVAPVDETNEVSGV